MNSYFYLQTEKNEKNADFIDKLQSYTEDNKKQVYVISNPLLEKKYSYDYSEALIVLAPKHKVAILNYGESCDNFENFVEDVMEDIASISDKFQYKEIIGRRRDWKSLFEHEISVDIIDDVEDFFETIKLEENQSIKKAELIISLFTGSINDIKRVKEDIPETNLDKVKQKIQLFDGDQTRFIYEDLDKKVIRIQGLSGTGKTELLLHKLKEIYVSEKNAKIFFTCHNKILANNLRKRIPVFFNFMKVEQQIEWETRLWCRNAWGSSSDINSGVYRYICAFYEIEFYSYSKMSFNNACELAIKEIKEKYQEIPPAFDYMFIDESQDFAEIFFELCQLVTSNQIYVAGDVFQSIFEKDFSNKIEPDYLLGKCYRTAPKTLMFAHALGMALFETPKLWWLEEKEWKDCGYNVTIDGEKSEYILSREPLRRFEDIESDYETMSILQETESSIAEDVIKVLRNIIEENPTVTPNDIGIVLIDTGRYIYRLANDIGFYISTELKWEVNKAYESKEKVNDTILISNRNNVKGLEFPFIICVSAKIEKRRSYRNTLYTMLTRSFIKTYFLLSKKEDEEFIQNLQKELGEIIANEKMIITEPTEEEKKKIKTEFSSAEKKISYYDTMKQIFGEQQISEEYHQKLINAGKAMEITKQGKEELEQFVIDNLRLLSPVH